MAKPTVMQRYHLGLFRFVRVFGLVFAVGSVLTLASNAPGLVRAGDLGQWAINLLAGAGFLAIGVLMFVVSGRALGQYRAYVTAPTAPNTCRMCKRPLGVETDPLSGDCGGDCWGCIGSIEADMGWEPSVEFVELEIKAGLRNPDGTAKPHHLKTPSSPT